MLINLRRILWLISICTGVAASAQPGGTMTALDRYVHQPDPAYAWQVLETDRGVLADTFILKLTSQQWRTSAEVDRPVWEHELIIVVPHFTLCGGREDSQTAVLIISGGRNPADGIFDGDSDNLTQVIGSTFCRVLVLLKQVPNQPLNFLDEFNRPRREDEILAYSFNRYLQTRDEQWPVHLAMTKAAVRAMDAVQAFMRQERLDVDITDFIVMGGSKRGWTTWLTAAVDERVRAIIPVSIDILNLGRQFTHHWETYGFYAPAVKEYIEYDLGCRLDSAQGRELLAIVDPYSYRDRYTMPKLIINSAGDQFFVSDASRFYYEQLPPPKQLRYTANTDHAQGETEEILDLILSAHAWIDDVSAGKAQTRYTWEFEPDGAIRVQTFTPPDRVSLWQAYNANARDFRLEAIGKAWTASPLHDTGGGVYRGFVPAPETGFRAFFIELEYDESNVLKGDQLFSTGVRIIPDILPFAQTSCPEFDDYSRLWWNPVQPGQAVELLQEGEHISGAWYLYDTTGKAEWLTFVGSLAGNVASGVLQDFTLAAPQNRQPAAITPTAVGTVSIEFHSGRSATMSYRFDDIGDGEHRGRLELVPFKRLARTPYSDIWYDPQQPGQGVTLVHQGQSLEGAWYLYDRTGVSIWVTFQGQLIGTGVNAELLRFTGPPLAAEPWDTRLIDPSPAGTVQIDLLAPESIEFHYEIDAVKGHLSLKPFRLFPETRN